MESSTFSQNTITMDHSRSIDSQWTESGKRIYYRSTKKAFQGFTWAKKHKVCGEPVQLDLTLTTNLGFVDFQSSTWHFAQYSWRTGKWKVSRLNLDILIWKHCFEKSIELYCVIVLGFQCLNWNTIFGHIHVAIVKGTNWTAIYLFGVCVPTKHKFLIWLFSVLCTSLCLPF